MKASLSRPLDNKIPVSVLAADGRKGLIHSEHLAGCLKDLTMVKIVGVAAIEPVMPWQAASRARAAIAAPAIIPAGS